MSIINKLILRHETKLEYTRMEIKILILFAHPEETGGSYLSQLFQHYDA